MKHTNKTIRATIIINRSDWELFRELAKTNESDASKEVRKFVKRYIAEHSNQIKVKGDKNESF